MLNGVQSYRLNPAVSFKGDENSQQPAKVNSGIKVGAAYATIGAVSTLSSTSITNLIKKQAPEIAEKMPKQIGMAIYIPVFIATALGCGAIVDKITNKKAAKFAQEVKGKDVKEVLKTNERADISGRNNLFYSSNTGKKVGTLLGVVALPLLSLLMNKGRINVVSVVASVINGALGGLLLGSITDALNNKAAEKNADNAANTKPEIKPAKAEEKAAA